MNNIGALIKKDLLFLVKTMKLQLVISLIMIITFSLGNNGWTPVVIVPYFLIYGQMAYEERGRTDQFIMGLPVTRSEICIAKYILSGLCMGIAVLISLIIMAIANEGIDFSHLVQIFGGTSIIGFAYIALVIPVVFKWGTEKSKYIMMGSYILMFVFMINSNMQPRLIQLLEQVEIGWGALFTVCLYGVSLMIALKIYNHKEF